jgi:hypothetical protein
MYMSDVHVIVPHTTTHMTRHLFELRRDVLLRLAQDVYKCLGLLGIACGAVESGGMLSRRMAENSLSISCSLLLQTTRAPIIIPTTAKVSVLSLCTRTRRKEGNGLALGAGPSRASHAVHVVLNLVADVVR